MQARKLLAVVLLLFPPSITYGSGLAELYWLAVANDPAMAQARAESFAGDERMEELMAGWLPQIALRASVRQKKVHGALGNGGIVAAVREREVAIVGTQRVFDRSAMHELAARRLESVAARFRRTAALQQMTKRFVSAYLDAIAGEDELELAEANVRLSAERVKLAASRLDTGLAAVSELYEAAARQAMFRKDVAGAAASLADARQALQQLTGVAPGALKKLRDLPDSTWAGFAIERALTSRPTWCPATLLALQHDVEAAKRRVAEARAGRNPTLQFQFSYGATKRWALSRGLHAPDSRENGRRRVQVGFVLSMPMDARAVGASIVRSAARRYDAKRYELEVEQRDVARKSLAARRATITSDAKLVSLKAAVNSAQLAVEATGAGLVSGSRGFSSLVEAELRLAKSRMDYSRARHGAAVEWINLNFQLGTLDWRVIEKLDAFLH